MNAESYPDAMSANAETATTPRRQRQRFERWPFWLPGAAIIPWVMVGVWQSWSGWQLLIVWAGITATLAAIDITRAAAARRRETAAAGSGS